MNNRKLIKDELSAISPTVAAIPVVNVFSAPNDYFNTISDDILSVIFANKKSIFTVQEKQPLSVPEGYFDSLADTILHKIKTQSDETVLTEIQHLSSVLSAIGNKNIFTLPKNYFENSVQQILNNVSKPAKLVQMKKRSSFFNYAAAAVVSGIIGLSVVSVLNNKSGNSLLPQTAMAQAGEIIKNNSFDRELNNVSDKEIQQYLEKRGQDVGAALVASSVEDSNLPNPEDYLTDDKTLDKYLNKINLTD